MIKHLILYTEPAETFTEKTGYLCSLKGKLEGDHEYCKCNGIDGGNDGETCKNACVSDLQCKGYDMDPYDKYCRIFTTSQCTSECPVKDKESIGSIGELDFQAHRADSTCAIKSKT